jgi:hypothetical protein
VNDWKAELDAFFLLREQQEPQQAREQAQSPGEIPAVEKFMIAVATPVFEEFGTILKQHGRHIRLRMGDSNVRIAAEYAGKEEFDYTLWAGGNGLSAELRADGKRTPDSFQNARGNSALADTTQEDVAQQLVEKYIVLTTPMFASSS